MPFAHTLQAVCSVVFHQPFAWLFQMLRYTLDCEAIVLGARLEFSLQARRGVRAPPTLLLVAALDPELSAPLGAASLVLHRALFD